MDTCVRLQMPVLAADHHHTLSSRAVLTAWETERLDMVDSWYTF